MEEDLSMEEEVLKCQLCDFQVETYTRLAFHMQEVHGDKDEAIGEFVVLPKTSQRENDAKSDEAVEEFVVLPKNSQKEKEPKSGSVHTESASKRLSEENTTSNQETTVPMVEIKQEIFDEVEMTYHVAEEIGSPNKSHEEIGDEDGMTYHVAEEIGSPNTSDEKIRESSTGGEAGHDDDAEDEEVNVEEVEGEEDGSDNVKTNTDAVSSQPFTIPSVLIVPKSTTARPPSPETDFSDTVPRRGKSFVCYICNLSFAKKDRLAAHVSYVHGGEKLYQCRVCFERFTWRETYRKHLNNVHNINTMQCNQCDFACSSRPVLLKHKKSHTQSVSHKCETCSKVFASESLLKEHKKCHSDKSPQIKSEPEEPKSPKKTAKPRMRLTHVTCETCNLVFKQRKYFTRHNRLVHGIYIRPPAGVQVATSKKEGSKTESSSTSAASTKKVTTYVCHVCKKQYTNYKAFWYHKRTTHGIFARSEIEHRSGTATDGAGPYKCHLCSISFANKSNLNRHYRTVHDNAASADNSSEQGTQADQPFPCDLCDRHFERKVSLSLHKVKSHQGEVSPGTQTEQSFPCDLCDRTFDRKVSLSLHKIKSHKEQVAKQHRCRECGRKFAKRKHLLCHEHWHKKARNKPFKCKNCELGFFKKVDLIRHSQVHKNEKPYICDLCDHKCSSQNALLIHKKSHQHSGGSSESTTCELCGEEFNSRIGKMYHMKSHPNVLTCDLCSYATFEEKNLNNHYQSHMNSENNMFKCSYRGCRFTCKTKEGLKTHLANHFKGSNYKCKDCDFRTKYKPNLFRHKETVHKSKPSTNQNVAVEESETPSKKTPMKKLVLRLKTLYPRPSSTSPVKVPVEEREDDNDDDGSDVERPKKKCRVCFKEFKFASHLRRHEWTHSDDKPFVCSNCGKGFVRHDQLKMHACQPVGNKGFKCMYCNEHFDSRSQLSLHQITHRQTDVRVKCPLCDETFRSRVDMACHQYSAHNEQAPPPKEEGGFTCGHCNRPFKLWRNMKVHIQKAGPCRGVPPIPNSSAASQQISPPWKNKAKPFKTPSRTPTKNDSTRYSGSSPLDLSVNDGMADVGSNQGKLHSLLVSKGSHDNVETNSQSGHDASSNGTDEGFSEKSASDSRSLADVSSPAVPRQQQQQQQQRFKCKHCEIAFPDVMMYTIHMGIHGPDHAFQCSNCGQNCGDRNSFMLHFIGQHS